MILVSEQLRSCPHYEPLPPGCDALEAGYDPATCVGCGGEPTVGPSPICPVFGEVDG